MNQSLRGSAVPQTAPFRRRSTAVQPATPLVTLLGVGTAVVTLVYAFLPPIKGITLYESLLACLTVYAWAELRRKRARPVPLLARLPEFSLLAIVAGALLTYASHRVAGEIVVQSTIAPLLVFWLARTHAGRTRDVRFLHNSAIAGACLFLVFVFGLVFLNLASAHYRPGVSVPAYDIQFGYVNTVTWGNWMSGIGATFAAVLFARVMGAGSFPGAVFYSLFFWGFTILTFQGGTKGGLLSLACALIAVLFVNRHKVRGLLLRFAAMTVLGVVLIGSTSLLGTSREDVFNVNRFGLLFDELWARRDQTISIEYRRAAFATSLVRARTSIVGSGFGADWRNEGIDESMYFLWITGGAGLLGLAGSTSFFVGLVLALAMVARRQPKDDVTNTAAALGAAVATGLMCLSSDQLLGSPFTGNALFLILGASLGITNTTAPATGQVAVSSLGRPVHGLRPLA